MVQLILFIDLTFLKKKRSLGIWNNFVKAENVDTSIQHQACTKMKSILDKFWLSRLQVNVQQM